MSMFVVIDFDFLNLLQTKKGRSYLKTQRMDRLELLWTFRIFSTIRTTSTFVHGHLSSPNSNIKSYINLLNRLNNSKLIIHLKNVPKNSNHQPNIIRKQHQFMLYLFFRTQITWWWQIYTTKRQILGYKTKSPKQINHICLQNYHQKTNINKMLLVFCWFEWWCCIPVLFLITHVIYILYDSVFI